MLSSKILPVVLLFFGLFWLLEQATCQFPSICNTKSNLMKRECCPNNCNGRGSCMNITANVTTQSNNADRRITTILQNAPSTQYKGTIDSRYLWPTLVFEKVCICTENYSGADCNDCAFGWTKNNNVCEKKESLVVRKSFGSLTGTEKMDVIAGFQALKKDMGHWTIIVSEPNTSEASQVELQEVSTYDYLVYIHNYVARDASKSCEKVNRGINVDFAHSGPNFPVWHRTYLLILERAMQRVLKNESFGFPYWKWESNEESEVYLNLFNNMYFGSLSSGTPGNKTFEYVTGGVLNSDWKTVCDTAYIDGNSEQYFDEEAPERLCENFWRVCNVSKDLKAERRLQRGNKETYLPSPLEIQMAIAAPAYDVMNSATNRYAQDSPTNSFRSRLEGWSYICSASNCLSPQISPKYQRMHNIIHDWVGGHMGIPASAVNDPIFSLHHTNIDRILESWMKRFTIQPLPDYMPTENGHPGHNRDDYMVPFFPLITPGQQYSLAENWGYRYDDEDLIKESKTFLSGIEECWENMSIESCFICHANSSCYCYRNNSNLNKSVYEECNCSSNSSEACKSASISSTSRPPSSNSSKLKANLLLFLIIALLVVHVMAMK